MPTIALQQIDAVPGDVDQNTALVAHRARHAIDHGADIVVFPELASSGYVVERDAVVSSAQQINGPFVATLLESVKGTGSLVVAGMCERDGDEFFNTVVVVDGDGPVLTYRKLHLFDREHDIFTAGDRLDVVETAHGVLGVCICYDLRFVEVMRTLALRGADIVLAPAAWVRGFDPMLSPEGLLPQAQAAALQANLNQVAVAAVSLASGTTRDGITTLGGSVAVDAYGELLAGPLPRHEAADAMVRVDLDDIRASRVRSPRIRPRDDRRTDVYALRYREELL